MENQEFIEGEEVIVDKDYTCNYRAIVLYQTPQKILTRCKTIDGKEEFTIMTYRLTKIKKMKTADEIYIKWYGEHQEGKHPEKSERDIIICAMEEYAAQEVIQVRGEMLEDYNNLKGQRQEQMRDTKNEMRNYGK